MADQKKIDVAAALAALAGGAVPSEAESPSGGIPSETTVFTPEGTELPADPPLAQSAPADPLQSQAISPFTPQEQPPTVRPLPTPAVNRPRSARASGPAALPKTPPNPSPAPPPARLRREPSDGPARARPAMPERASNVPVQPATEEELPDTILEIFEDDDDTIAAAPDASAFARRDLSHKSSRAPIHASLFFRRTLIPILLTCGVMLPAIGVWSMIDRSAPLAAVGTGVEVMLIAVGAVLLGLGIINALHVRQALQTAAKQQKA